jgi:hypothetical protein
MLIDQLNERQLCADLHIESLVLSNLGTGGLGHAASVSMESDRSASEHYGCPVAAHLLHHLLLLLIVPAHP